MATKITERDILNSIIDGTVETDTLVSYAEKKLAQLDKRNASAKARAEKKRAEGDELTEAVFSFVTDEAQTRAQIVEAMAEAGYTETAGKIGYKLTFLVKENRILKEEIAVAGEDGKSKRVMSYRLA